MGRKTSHQEEKAVQGELLHYLLGHQEMAIVRRIKGASEKAQTQGGHASGGPLEPNPSPSPDFLRSL